MQDTIDHSTAVLLSDLWYVRDHLEALVFLAAQLRQWL